jgi:release factor glutamine methyltransferase
MIRQFFKRASFHFLVPLVKWYLRKERRYSYNGTSIRVSPGVFHPGLFYSTRFLLEYLAERELTNKSVLELGCGTGLISIECAKRGALVTAADLSLTATQNAQSNALQANVTLDIIHTDLFDNIEVKQFDWIVINPPYYARPVRNEEELAWNCGEQFQYFRKLFSQLHDYSSSVTMVIMVLTKGCDISTIGNIAKEKGFTIKLLREKNVFFDEKDYLFKIQSSLGA